MAINPFTQPMKQGKFIPSRPKLPTQAIGGAAKNIYKQDLKQRDRLNQIMNKLAQQKVSDKDRGVLKELENRYRGQMEALAEDNNLVFDDRQRINEMAREFSQDAQVLEQNRKNIQEQIKNIEDRNISQPRKRQLKQALLDRAGLRTTEKGRVDPESVFSPTNVGDEANIRDVAVDAVQNLPNRVLRANQEGGLEQAPPGFENLSINQELGLAEFSQLEGVTPERMEGAIMESYRNNPEIQNWIDNTTTIRAKQYESKGMDPQEAREKAQKDAQSELKKTASRVANRRYKLSMDKNRRSLPEDFGTDKTSGGSVIEQYGLPRSQNQLSGAEKKEFDDRKEMLIDQKLQDTFNTNELSTINRIERQVEKSPGQHTPESGVTGRVQRGGLQPGPQQSSTFTGKQEQLKNRLQEEGLWKRYKDVNETVEETFKNSPEYAPQFLKPGEKGENEYDQFVSSLQEIPKAMIESEDLETLAEEDVGYFTGPGKEELTQDHARIAFNNAQDVSISGDASSIRIRVGDTPKDYTELEGKTVRLSTDSMTESQLKNLTKHFPESQEQTLINNFRAKNTAITSDNPYTVPGTDSVQVQRTGPEQFTVRDESGPINYNSVIQNVPDDPKRQRQVAKTLLTDLKQLGDFEEISNMDSFAQGLRDYQEGKDTRLANQMRDFLNSPVRFVHKGNAIEAGLISSGKDWSTFYQNKNNE